MRGTSIIERLWAVQERIQAAARLAGRDPASVTLVAVTKTHSPEIVAEAVAAGATDLGENRVQEAATKIPTVHKLLSPIPNPQSPIPNPQSPTPNPQPPIPNPQPPTPNPQPQIRWHLIGHLQRNKARVAAELFDLVHSVDSLRLAEALARAAPAGRRLPVLLQVNVSGEASKEGFSLTGGLANQSGLAALLADVELIAAMPTLAVRGLMTIAPIVDHPEQARPVFRALRELRDELARHVPSVSWDELSMGMTDDFEAAIAEGATIVRVGRAIFGERA